LISHVIGLTDRGAPHAWSAVVVQETAKAAGQVLGHLGAAIVGSFGGALKIFR
jgi:hypothetical protein